jgi:L-2-hydroxyglutarate oxidase LhgO
MKIIIIGGGIIGLATARALLKKFPKFKVTLLEKEPEIARHQTRNNSGVVHSGIYYKPGSLKAKNCTLGKKMLLDFCDEMGVPYENTHKVLVATKREELTTLKELYKRGGQNAVEVKEISKEELLEIEPHAAGLKGLLVPKCQIIDYSKVSAALAKDIEERGGSFLLGEKLTYLRYSFPRWVIETLKQTHTCDFVINCAGLYSDSIAKMALPNAQIPCQILPFREEYYELKKPSLVKGLIYPMPNPRLPFLGAHLNKMSDGKVEAGPNTVLATAREGYLKTSFSLKEFSETLTYSGFWKFTAKYFKTGIYEMHRSLRKKAFTKSLNLFVPEIQMEDLEPLRGGVRAQAVKKDGSLVDDFLIVQDTHSLHVLNAPSPSATSSLSIGQTIASMIEFEEWLPKHFSTSQSGQEEIESLQPSAH